MGRIEADHYRSPFEPDTAGNALFGRVMRLVDVYIGARREFSAPERSTEYDEGVLLERNRAATNIGPFGVRPRYRFLHRPPGTTDEFTSEVVDEQVRATTKRVTVTERHLYRGTGRHGAKQGGLIMRVLSIEAQRGVVVLPDTPPLIHPRFGSVIRGSWADEVDRMQHDLIFYPEGQFGGIDSHIGTDSMRTIRTPDHESPAPPELVGTFALIAYDLEAGQGKYPPNLPMAPIVQPTD